MIKDLIVNLTTGPTADVAGPTGYRLSERPLGLQPASERLTSPAPSCPPFPDDLSVPYPLAPGAPHPYTSPAVENESQTQ